MMDWSVFIFALLDWLKECLEERRREDVEATMKRAGFAVRRGVTKLLREQGLSGHTLREEADEAMQFIREMDDEDRKCLLDDAEARLMNPRP